MGSLKRSAEGERNRGNTVRKGESCILGSYCVFYLHKKSTQKSAFFIRRNYLSIKYHIFNIRDGDFDAGIGLDFLADFVSCVDNRRMVAPTEHLTYLHKRHR